MPPVRALLAARATGVAREAACLRLSAIDQVSSAGFGFLGSCLSCADLVAGAFAVFDFPRPGREDGSDHLVLAKGHAAPVLYAALTAPGGDVPYARAGSHYPGHPNARLTPHIQVSSGSVGMGFAIGTGIAAGLELSEEPGRIVVLAGDGELQAGALWEALLCASGRSHWPVLLVVDVNGFQSGGTVPTNDRSRAMLAAAVPRVAEIDGNAMTEVLETFERFAEDPALTVVWATTRRGAGVPVLEDHPHPMGWCPDDAALGEARATLRRQLDPQDSS